MKKLYLFVCILIVTTLNLTAKDIAVESLPKLLGLSNMGREFYFSFIPCWESPAKNDLKIYISSNVETMVTVEVEGKGYFKQQKTIPNGVIEFTLSPSIGQAYRKTQWEPSEPDNVWRDAGVHVIADDPIICYGMTRYQYSSDGFLALPVNVLGKEYIVASYNDVSTNVGQYLPSYTAITAVYDKTKVYFTMGGTAWSKTAGGLLPGQTSSWNLYEGDVLLISSLGQKADLTGSIIKASKPVAVVSGNYCAYVPTSCGCCDVIEEMEIPTNYWGTEYHVSPIVNRLKSSLIRVFAKEAKTKIYRDHVQIGFLRYSGGQQDDGWLEFRAIEGTPKPVVISGDKPIGVTQYNTGQQDDNVVSDPFQMVLIPIEQYEREMVFNTPGIKGGFGFPYNYVNICYEAVSDSVPDDLEFAQVTDGSFTWTKIKDMSPSPGSAFNKVMGGKNYYSKTVSLPGDGVYRIRSNHPLQAYLYGLSLCDSYGFPASAALKDVITKVDTMPPEPVWVLDCDGTVNLHKTEYVTDKPDEESNRSNMSTIYMHANESYNYKLYYGDFMPCEVQTVPWRLEIIDNREDARAVVTFADCAGNDTTVYIDYYAPKMVIVPKVGDYGLHRVGQTTDKMFYVVNQSKTSACYLKYLELKLKDEYNPPKPQGFTIWDSTGTSELPNVFGGDHNPGIRIEPLDSMPFIVRFEATKGGEFWDSIGLGDTCNFWYKAYVTAEVGVPVIEVSDWLFPTTTIDSSSVGQFEIENIGTVPLEIYGYTGPYLTGMVSGTNIFVSQELADQNITESTPLTLNPKETRTFQIKFTPDEDVSFVDSILFISNSIKNPQLNNGNSIDSVCILAGNGTTVDVDDNCISNCLYIYPVPASDKIEIISESEIKNIKVFDILGCERNCQFANSEGRSIVNTSDLNEGVYFILVNVNEQALVRKFLVRK